MRSMFDEIRANPRFLRSIFDQERVIGFWYFGSRLSVFLDEG